jgi:Na+-driven multidrug efflux pump
MSVVSLALTLWPTPFLTIFNADPDVIEAGTVKLVIMAWSYVIYAASEVVTGCLRGMRKTSITTGLNIFCICGIRLLWIWCVCPMAPENYGLLYMCYPVSYIFSLVALSIYYVIVNKDLARKAAAAASGT